MYIESGGVSRLEQILTQARTLAERACDLLHLPYVTETEIREAAESLTLCCAALSHLDKEMSRDDRHDR